MWKRRPVESGAGIDLHDVIDRVTHAIEERDGRPQVRARRYTATFDGAGVRLTPRGEPGEARVHTTRIALGDRDVYRGTASGTWSLLGNTAQTLRAPGIVEHHEAERDGIEVAWVLRERGAGDLTIEIALEGDVHVGQAELVDSRGQRWPIETETTSAGARWRVDAAILDHAAFPVALDPLIGPEHAADDIVLANSLDWQRLPAVTSNANGYFVVWADDDNNRIGATRVTPTGMLLDPAGITVGPSVGAAPRVASNGTDFLIVFEQLMDVRAVRVGASGVVLDSSSLSLCGSVDRCGSPDVASNGSGYLVTWQDTRTSTNTLGNVFAARVTSAGVVQDPGGFVVTDTVADQRTPAVASNGSDYMVVWTERSDTTDYDAYGSRVTAAGSVLDPGGFPISMAAGAQTAPRIASNGSSYLAVWEDGRSGNSYDIYGARLTTTGAVSDPNGLPISTGVNNQMRPTVASNGTDFLVTWETDLGIERDVYASRVTGTGTVVDSAGIAIATGSTDQRIPAVASYGTGYLVAWQAFFDIRAALISGAGAVSASGTPLALSSNERKPAIASNGTGYLVAWQDARGGDSTGFDIYAARLSTSGATLDPAGLALSTAIGGQVDPAVASNGTDYLVAWQDTRAGNDDIYATLVSATGAISDPSGLVVSTTPAAQMDPAVASDGTDYVVAWQDSRNSTGSETEYDIYAARITSAGANLDPTGIAVSTVSGQQRAPTVASNGIGYLLAWEDRRAGSNVYATRMATSGAILDGSGFVAGSSPYVYQAALASNGTDYLVAWEDLNSHVFATRISAAGNALVPMNIPLGATTASQREPAVASNGVEYVVWWQDGSGPRYSDIYACRVTAAGDVVDVTGYPIAAGADAELAPTAAYNASTGMYAVAYESNDRIFARLVSFCGDFSIEASETCDDGNSASGDGCSSTCQREPGFECAGTPSVCTDIDECAVNNGGCTQVCTNTSPGFTCTCATGYAGDGIACADIDECATNNGDCAGTCTNSDGSYACACSTGFELDPDGHACNDIDECAADNGGCSPNATCTNTAPGFSCACANGYAGDGVTCADIDECTTNNGGCTQVCTNSPGAFACSCNSGYMLADDGVTCVAIDACIADPDSCESDDGCGCRSSTPSSSALWLVVLGLVLRRRRKQT
ncbi:MAG: hypothetical protein HOV81_43195 [Kofleriaceae bacterium]|nr:hypothetical protein [Kofleriaceae bacterium]